MEGPVGLVVLVAVVVAAVDVLTWGLTFLVLGAGASGAVFPTTGVLSAVAGGGSGGAGVCVCV